MSNISCPSTSSLTQWSYRTIILIHKLNKIESDYSMTNLKKSTCWFVWVSLIKRTSLNINAKYDKKNKNLVLVRYRNNRYPGCTTRTSVPSQPSYKKEKKKRSISKVC